MSLYQTFYEYYSTLFGAWDGAPNFWLEMRDAVITWTSNITCWLILLFCCWVAYSMLAFLFKLLPNGVEWRRRGKR